MLRKSRFMQKIEVHGLLIKQMCKQFFIVANFIPTTSLRKSRIARKNLEPG